jgi:hypothetical protein
LPYQLYYSQEQLHKAYPEVDDFFAVKKKYDPSEIFMNKWYEKYGNKKYRSSGVRGRVFLVYGSGFYNASGRSFRYPRIFGWKRRKPHV